MTPEKKKQLTSDIGFTLMMIGVLLFIVRLWPILLLLLIGLIAYALWLLFHIQKQPVKPEPTAPLLMLPAPVSEESVLSSAFGLLQRRITEEVVSEYPNARWVWGVPDAFHLFTSGRPLTILLNGAGGYRKADVLVCNLQFVGLAYAPAPNTGSPKPEPDEGNLDDTEHPEPEEVDYGLLAFEWVEANLQKLNAQANVAVSSEHDTFRIPAEELPHGDSWPAICEELVHNGFLTAKPLADGIQVKVKTE